MKYIVDSALLDERLDKYLQRFIASMSELTHEYPSEDLALISRSIISNYLEQSHKQDSSEDMSESNRQNNSDNNAGILGKSLNQSLEIPLSSTRDIPMGVYVNRKRAKKSTKIFKGDEVDFDIADIIKFAKFQRGLIANRAGVVPQQGDLEILYENARWLVLNKPKGIPVHPGISNYNGTLANYVRYYLENKGEYDNNVVNAGIVHRLDKGVSGILIVAKKYEEQVYLQSLFSSHKVDKFYVAEIENSRHNMNREGEWIEYSGYINRDSSNRKRRVFVKGEEGIGRKALTYIYFLSKNKALIQIKTGRNHQIRATLKSIGLVIKGDELYSVKKANVFRKVSQIELASIYLGFTDREKGYVKWCIDSRYEDTISQRLLGK